MGLIQSLAAFGRRAPVVPPTAHAVIARMRALAEEDGAVAAVEYAAPLGPALDDAALWREIGTLRMQAAKEVAGRAQPRAPWPPRLADPFPDLMSLPVVAARDLTAELLGGAILHHGSLLVRGLLTPADAAWLREGVDSGIAGYDALAGGGAPSTDYVPVDVPDSEPLHSTRPWTRESGGVWALEAPRAFEAAFAMYRASGVIDAIAGYMGERPLLSVGKTVFRRAEAESFGVFHQDGAFMGAGIRTVNVWTALSPCGERAPGLEVVARRLDGLAPTGGEGAIFPWAVGRPGAEIAAAGAPIVFPVFEAGDALLFDHLMLHATGVKPGMDQRRYALESWFFAPSAHAADQVPVYI